MVKVCRKKKADQRKKQEAKSEEESDLANMVQSELFLVTTPSSTLTGFVETRVTVLMSNIEQWLEDSCTSWDKDDSRCCSNHARDQAMFVMEDSEDEDHAGIEAAGIILNCTLGSSSLSNLAC